MKRVICNNYFDEDYSEKFSFDGKKIHVPARHQKIEKRQVLRKIEDTEGNVLLSPTYLSERAETELYRYLPSWGLKIVKTVAGNPNVWVVDSQEVEV